MTLLYSRKKRGSRGQRVISLASESGHSITRPTAYGSRVPPFGHLLVKQPVALWESCIEQ